ncbi:MAG TPA: bestrophin family ion channel [Polyangiales bacterium]|nr:bestrophin family ion channel [Polyangiales bacterium]
MIVPDRKMSWFGLLFDMRGSTLPRIAGRLAAVFVVACAVTLESYLTGGVKHDLSTVPFTLISLALGVFLGFRNNTSYDRYWEGRKLWGKVVNDARSFARLTLHMIAPDATPQAQLDAHGTRLLQQELIYRTIAFVHALRMHLRNQLSDVAELSPFLREEEIDALPVQRNVPLAILHSMSSVVQQARRAGVLRHRDVHMLEAQINDLCDVQGGCERIKNTPIPWSYTVLMHSIVAAYCFALPFGLIATVQLATPLVVALIAYAFLGLDAVGDELEEPFGTDVNDLPLSQLSRMIEVNLRQMLGEEELPPMITPGPDRVLT